jgi:hypothetical protein
MNYLPFEYALPERTVLYIFWPSCQVDLIYMYSFVRTKPSSGDHSIGFSYLIF